MSEHTKEPWIFTHNNFEISSIYADGKIVAECPIDEKVTEENEFDLVSIKEANARRIVACVNACAGIDTETLENHAGQQGLMIYLMSDLVKQRDELLAAAKNLRDVKGRYNTEIAMKRLIETIAKVESEK